MTDSPDAHAHPSEPAGPEEEPRSAQRPWPGDAPAAHAHPARPGTAVLESRPPQTPTQFGWPSPPRANGAEPPPFGFNAPAEAETALPGSRSASPGRAGAPSAAPSVPSGFPAAAVAAAPAPVEPAAAPSPSLPPRPEAPLFERPFTAPARPQSSTLASPTAQPRELMPTTLPSERHRLGEQITPTFGPPGRHRSPAAMALLSILTLGIHSIAWHRRVNAEMGDFDPRIHVHPARSAWAVFLPWFAGLLASAAAAGIVLASHYGLDLHLGITAHSALPGVAALAAVPYLILFLPFSLVAVVRTAERVRMVEEHAGVTTDEQIRPASVVGWLLVPVIGGLVLMGRQQGHLNRIWDLAGE
ncbi:MAG TPA: hypothetical protein VN193_08740 [Candidatus Angelobacter sp.]|jgi:hypothetical protein|nr:hypothetical protein [Candidatus Angelobacter sp.]